MTKIFKPKQIWIQANGKYAVVIRTEGYGLYPLICDRNYATFSYASRYAAALDEDKARCWGAYDLKGIICVGGGEYNLITLVRDNLYDDDE
jgi:hypothetical protein